MTPIDNGHFVNFGFSLIVAEEQETHASMMSKLMNEQMAILICEDDPDDVLLIKHIFKKLEISVPIFFVSDGAEALEYLAGDGTYSDREAFPFPQMMITDLKMPRADGFEVLKWLQNHPQTPIIPTVVWSSSTLDDDIRRAYALGAHCYIRKVTNLSEWEEIMNLLFNLWQKAEVPCTPNGKNMETPA